MKKKDRRRDVNIEREYMGNELHGQLILTYPLMANLHLP
jgi:hypothetical protein